MRDPDQAPEIMASSERCDFCTRPRPDGYGQRSIRKPRPGSLHATICRECIADLAKHQQPEPLTRERSRAWLGAERTGPNIDRRELIADAIVHGHLNALADLLVDAAAGRVK